VREACDCEEDTPGGDVMAVFNARRSVSKDRIELSNSVCASYISCQVCARGRRQI
jgi:hypothetical protein